MPKKKETVVLVTGVAGYWGARLAGHLLTHPGLRVLGVDHHPPAEELKGLDFVQADVRNALLEDLLRAERVQAVAHLAFVESLRPSEATFDLNVMGTMKLTGACARAGVRKLVIKSSAMVYGALPSNSAYLTEDDPLQGSRRYGYTRDALEIEAFCNGVPAQSPDLQLTLLRFPGIAGPHVETPLTRFLNDREAPSLLGFDPLIQVIHADDVVAALEHAVLHDLPGVYNVAAEGVLPLWRAMGLAGKVPLPVAHPLVYWAVSLGMTRHVPIEPDYLRFPWVGDLSKLHASFGFTPRYSAEETLREFAGQQRTRRHVPEAAALAYDEERLRDTIERRRRAREEELSHD
jgi:UDP-glucose 4-epimerase